MKEQQLQDEITDLQNEIRELQDEIKHLEDENEKLKDFVLEISYYTDNIRKDLRF